MNKGEGMEKTGVSRQETGGGTPYRHHTLHLCNGYIHRMLVLAFVVYGYIHYICRMPLNELFKKAISDGLYKIEGLVLYKRDLLQDNGYREIMFVDGFTTLSIYSNLVKLSYEEVFGVSRETVSVQAIICEAKLPSVRMAGLHITPHQKETKKRNRLTPEQRLEIKSRKEAGHSSYRIHKDMKLPHTTVLNVIKSNK